MMYRAQFFLPPSWLHEERGREGEGEIHHFIDDGNRAPVSKAAPSCKWVGPVLLYRRNGDDDTPIRQDPPTPLSSDAHGRKAFQGRRTSCSHHCVGGSPRTRAALRENSSSDLLFNQRLSPPPQRQDSSSHHRRGARFVH